MQTLQDRSTQPQKQNNWQDNMEYIVDIINTTTFIVCLASIIANFTPSTKDDVFISKIGNLIQLLALNFNIKR